ncbi:hypothetical protein ABT224_16420 [Streptomyces sp. NPDC001584]|uniref:hypothetical protein n=1 Tax=Streptomyces sp. NPDC001584 TaxID=3154521 RepID=UPI003332EA3E
MISPALSTVPPAAQTTCSLRRGASRSTPARSTTNVTGSDSSVAAGPEAQSSNSAAERMLRPSPSGRTSVLSSAGPTYR